MSFRKIEIDTLRGLACLLLVFHHSIEGYFKVGLLPESSFLVKFSIALKYLRMPLFTFLSGYVYSLHPVGLESIKKFSIGKFRRLGIPLLCIGIPMALLQSEFGTGQSLSITEALLSPIYPQTLFWYLNALLIIFFIMAAVEILQLFNTLAKASFVFFLSILVFISPLREVIWFGISGASYLLPFFILGAIVSRYQEQLNFIFKPWFKILFASTVIFVVLRVFFSEVHYSDVMDVELFPFLLSTVLCLGIYSLRLKSTFLSIVGAFSYTIYLYHSLGAPAMRIIGIHLFGRDFFASDFNLYLFVIIGGLVGIVIPIIIHKAFVKNGLLSLLFLGIKKKIK